MNKSIWEWLEIEPTGEISEIRAAYARQVKKYHPEDTPEEFEQLQKAYKSALRQARAAKRMETVPQSVQESQKSGSGFEKRDMPGFFENDRRTECAVMGKYRQYVQCYIRTGNNTGFGNCRYAG